MGFSVELAKFEEEDFYLDFPFSIEERDIIPCSKIESLYVCEVLSLYGQNNPIEQPIWKNGSIIGHIKISLSDAEILNGLCNGAFYIGEKSLD